MSKQKPEKITGKNSKFLPFGYWEKCQGYNEACDDWEAWLAEMRASDEREN